MERRNPVADDIDGALLSDGSRFTLFQAIRLLRRYQKRYNKKENNTNDSVSISVKPHLSLNSQTSQVHTIKQRKRGFEIETTMFGLYGASSPLPSYYTTELLEEENNEKTIKRDFIDIINQQLYKTLFDVYLKNRSDQRVFEEEDIEHRHRLDCFGGINHIIQNNSDFSIMRKYAALLGQPIRSAEGLRAIISDVTGSDQVKVIQFEPASTPIESHEKIRLGKTRNQLGENTYAGHKYKNRSTHLRIRLGPLIEGCYRNFIPGGQRHEHLKKVIETYVNGTQICIVEMILDASSCDYHSVRPGVRNWSTLGIDTWLKTKKKAKDKQNKKGVRFVI